MPEAVLWEGGLLSRGWLRCVRETRTPCWLSPTPPLAFPSPETTSASLGPTVWQLPMAPLAGKQASGCSDLEGCGGSAAPAAPSLSRLPQPRPPAPLCGRGPAGSVAAEGGAGMLKEAGASASAVSLLYSRGLGPGAPLGHHSSITLHCVTSGTRPTADPGAQNHGPCPESFPNSASIKMGVNELPS